MGKDPKEKGCRNNPGQPCNSQGRQVLTDKDGSDVVVRYCTRCGAVQSRTAS